MRWLSSTVRVQFVLGATLGAIAPPARADAPPELVVDAVATADGAVLERRAGTVGLLDDDGDTRGTAALWERVCPLPCRARVAAGAELRVAGAAFAPSAPFALPRGASAVRVRARMGDAWVPTTWRALASTGAGIALAGLVLACVPSPDDPSSAGTFDGLHRAGTVGLVAGAALVLVGLPLWIAGGTDVEATPAPPSGLAPAATSF